MATEAPNTLKSMAKYHVTDIVSEGPFKGLAEGLKSIYLDGTSIESSVGVLNFKNFKKESDLTILPRAYLPDQVQSIISGASNSTATESVNVKVTKNSPEGSGSGDGSVSRTISSAELDAIRVTMRVPALVYQDLATGDSVGTSIDFKISVSSNGGPFVPAAISSKIWQDWPLVQEESDADATNLLVNIQAQHTSLAIAKSISFEYARKVGGVWGSWVRFESFDIPAASPSSAQSSYWSPMSWEVGVIKNFSGMVTGLEAGTYKIRVVYVGCTGSIYYKGIQKPASTTISGKCVAPYDASYLVPLPVGGAPWTVKVERLTDDRVETNYQDDLYWLSYNEVLYEKFSWPYLSGFELTFDAEDFDSIPDRAYDVYGMVISVPSNYDPYNRTYSGIWDGTFKQEWTDNPAWILYDLVSKKRYGLGEEIPDSYLAILKWSLYSIAQYCDEPVTVQGTITEPRYTCSISITSQQEAYDLLNQIVSTFRGMLYPAGDGLIAVADRLTDPVINVGPANVIDGMFTYQGPARKTIHTAAYVTWNNPDDEYKLNTVLYENREGIRRYGYRTDKINAIGACSKSLAIRLAKWKVLTEVMAPDTVTYRASFDHLNVMPADIINISDPAYTSEELFGRIKSITENVETSTHTFELDRSVVRIGGDESLLEITLPDQTTLSLDVSVAVTATGTEIEVATALITTMPAVGAIWLLSKETVRPRMWRVFNIEEAESNVYEVSASLIDPNKWTEIEGGFNFAPADYTGFPTGELPAPTGLDHSEFLKQSGNSVVCCVNLSWTRPADARAALFRAEYRKENEPWKSTEPVLCQNPSLDIFNIDPGVYDFRVMAQDSTGLMKSDWAYQTSQTLLGKKKAPENITNFTASVEKFGILLKWTPISDIDIDYYEVRNSASWASGEATAKRVKATELKIEDATTGTYTFWIAAKDTSDNYSTTPVSLDVTVSVQSAPTILAATVNGGVQISIGGDVQRGFKAYEIQRRVSPAGTPSTINSNVLTRIFTDSDIATLGYSSAWQYRVRSLDQNGSASAWSDYSVAKTAKQVETEDLTNQPIIGKYFATAANVGCAQDGILFNASGIQAWQSGVKTVDIPVTGNPIFSGTITANCGFLGGWGISCDAIAKTNIAGGVVSLNSLHGSVYSHRCDPDHGEWHGNIYNGGWTDRYGFAVTRGAGNYIFRADTDINGANACNQIAGWSFDSTHIYSNNLGIYSTGTIQTLDFVTGNKGWKIDCVGNAEFNSINARGFIRTAVFIKDEISVVGGYTMIRPAGVISSGSCLASANTFVYMADTAQFAVNDIVRIKDGINDYWGLVGSISAGAYLNVAYLSCSCCFSITPGQAVVNYGSCLGCGGIMLNGQSPYIDIYTHSGTPWTSTCSRGRMGNLNGWGTITGDTYGLALGSPTGNYLTYDNVSGNLNILGNINVLSTLPLSMPSGAIGDWSAKGSNTATIALVGGVKDVSGFGLNGTAIGGVAVVDSTIGKAFSFDGIDDAITTSHTDTVFVGNNDWSINIWVNVVKGGTAKAFVSKGTTAAGELLFYRDSSDNLRINVDGAALSAAIASSGWTENVWNMVTAVKSGTNAYLYLNGQLKATDSSATVNINTTKKIAIGASQQGTLSRMSGMLAMPKMFNRGITAEEIKTLYLLGTQQESGIITADRVVTGILQSINLSTSLGSCLNLNDGTFVLGGTSTPKLSWNGVLLAIDGKITANEGFLGGWGISCEAIAKATTAGGVTSVNSVRNSVYSHRCDPNYGEWHGQIYNNGSWTGRYGLAVTRGAGNYLFRSDTDIDGANACNQIAGWGFNASCFYSTGLGLVLNSSGSISGNYLACTTGWAILADGSAEFNNVTARGTIYASAGDIGLWNISSGNLFSRKLITTNCGFFDLYNSAGQPQLGICHYCTTTGTTTSTFSYKAWFDGSNYSFAPLQVYSCGNVTAYFERYVCAGLGFIAGTMVSPNFATPTGLGGSDMYINGSRSGIGTSLAAIGINMCGGTDRVAFSTNGCIHAAAFCIPSDRNLKTDFQEVNILGLLRRMPVTKWRFKDSQDFHIGPMAQDFNEIFRLSHNWETNLTVGGFGGIALKAIKEVDSNVQEHDKEILALKKKIVQIETQLSELKEAIAIH